MSIILNIVYKLLHELLNDFGSYKTRKYQENFKVGWWQSLGAWSLSYFKRIPPIQMITNQNFLD